VLWSKGYITMVLMFTAFANLVVGCSLDGVATSSRVLQPESLAPP
jgi:hypothetical protein